MDKVLEFLKKNNMLDVSPLPVLPKEDRLAVSNYNGNTEDGFKTLGKVLAIDAGGTNLRFSLFEDEEKISEEVKPMYGVEKEISSDEFFDLLALDIEKYDCKNIGFCFSYPAISLPSYDAEIVLMGKEIKIKGVKGKIIGEELNRRLKDKREFFILNDTVACQLGVGADIGMILGTGFNMSYTDLNTGKIVNPELGTFGKVTYGRFDHMLNTELKSMGEEPQKLVSGAYLGKLIEITAREYFGVKLPVFELKDVSKFLLGEGKLYDFFDEGKREEFKEIVEEILLRAAKIVAGFVEELAIGRERIVIGIEGSTIYKIPGYYDKVVGEIKKIKGVEFEFKDARGSISLGTKRAVR